MFVNFDVKKIIKRRLNEFNTLGDVGAVVFDFSPFLNFKVRASLQSELAFCISTANSSAVSGLRFQKQLEAFNLHDFKNVKLEELLKSTKVRFHSKKAAYISNALSNFTVILDALCFDDERAREKLVKSVKGIGYKEASHFLRNIGRKNVAIVDRHILRWMYENEYIDKIPINIRKKDYLKFEKILRDLSNEKRISLAELDLILWYKKTGKVLK